MQAEDLIRSLIRAGVKPNLIWAACRTGRLVTGESRSSLSKEDVAEWENALVEYERKFPADDWDMKNIQDVIIQEKF
jgi:hypothetical protein